MTYLVDGNNVMGQRVGWHRDRAGARRRLTGELERFANRIGEPVEVVFDGRPDPELGDGERLGGARVWFAGRGRDADSLIEELAAGWSGPDALRVVTSDRRLAEAVRGLGAEVIRSGELRRWLDGLAGEE